MYTTETDFYHVSLDTSAKVATLRWRKDVKLQEFKQGCLVLASFFQNFNITRGLIDLNKRGTLPVEAEEWLETLNTNTAVQTGDLQIAMVMSEERYQHLIYDYSHTLARPHNLPILFNYFTNHEEAMDWLQQEAAEVA